MFCLRIVHTTGVDPVGAICTQKYLLRPHFAVRWVILSELNRLLKGGRPYPHSLNSNISLRLTPHYEPTHRKKAAKLIFEIFCFLTPNINVLSFKIRILPFLSFKQLFIWYVFIKSKIWTKRNILRKFASQDFEKNVFRKCGDATSGDRRTCFAVWTDLDILQLDATHCVVMCSCRYSVNGNKIIHWRQMLISLCGKYHVILEKLCRFRCRYQQSWRRHSDYTKSSPMPEFPLIPSLFLKYVLILKCCGTAS